MTPAGRTEQIKQFFDTDSVQYLQERYPTEPRTCDQFSYIARREHVLSMLSRIGQSGRLLDIGCGPAVLTRDLVARGWTVKGIDLSSGMLAAGRRAMAELPPGSAQFAAALGTAIPFQDKTFDAVLCIGVVSYIEDVPLLLREVHRVLKPGGQAIFQISNASSIAGADAWVWHHVRRIRGRFRQLDTHDAFRASVKLHWHHPRNFDGWMRDAQLDRREYRFFDFRPPLVVDRLSQSLSLAVGRRLESIGGSRASMALASGYLVRVSRAPGDGR